MDQRRIRALALGLPALFVAVGLVALLLIRADDEPPVGPDGARPSVGAMPSVEPAPSLPPLLSTEEIYSAFTAGGPATSGGEPVRLSTFAAGELVLPTGRLVAADVFFFDDTAFARTVRAGRYPVSLLKTADGRAFGYIAAAMIRFGPGDPVSWELALRAGQDAATLLPGEFFGYGVDSGTGSFSSPEAVAAVSSAVAFDVYSEEIHHGMFPGDNVADWNHSVEVVVDEATGANVIGFSSGFGDGAYPSWFGLDAGGEPLVALTDFGILEAPAP
jgi:hypothetical protein